jgi:hypothetical protein
LWVSCYASNPDLLRTDVNTGTVDQTYNIANGLGSLAYDANDNALWAGWGNDSSDVTYIQLDGTQAVSSSHTAFSDPSDVVCGLDDGLGYDGSDNTLYISDDCSTTVHQRKTDGTSVRDIPFAGSDCYNSGVAIGGNLLFEGSDGCSHVWVVDKTTNAPAFDFNTGANGVRDEGMSCDPNTFASQGKEVIWSKEAYSPNRAIAFEIPAGTCGAGGVGPPPSDKSISAAGVSSFTGTEPASVSGPVATFTDPDSAATASEYSASIDWGDGSAADTGTITQNGDGSFSVSGGHTYSDEGSDTITVTVTDTDNTSNSATVTDGVTVNDASLSAAGGTLGSPSTQSASGTTAKFTDANTSATTADFTATIDWGDGNTSGGTVSGSGASYSVSGSHTYTTTGYFTIKTHIVDDGGSTADPQTNEVLIYASTKGGNFVISYKKIASGTSVNFWGSQWAKNNPLLNTPPSAMKGFEDQPTTPTCGHSWMTNPGNSVPPPNGPLPAYMAVLASSKVSGAPSNAITGDTLSEVVVQTNPGYGPQPSTPGTGTVVAKIC